MIPTAFPLALDVVFRWPHTQEITVRLEGSCMTEAEAIAHLTEHCGYSRNEARRYVFSLPVECL